MRQGQLGIGIRALSRSLFPDNGSSSVPTEVKGKEDAQAVVAISPGRDHLSDMFSSSTAHIVPLSC